MGNIGVKESITKALDKCFCFVDVLAYTLRCLRVPEASPCFTLRHDDTTLYITNRREKSTGSLYIEWKDTYTIYLHVHYFLPQLNFRIMIYIRCTKNSYHKLIFPWSNNTYRTLQQRHSATQHRSRPHNTKRTLTREFFTRDTMIMLRVLIIQYITQLRRVLKATVRKLHVTHILPLPSGGLHYSHLTSLLGQATHTMQTPQLLDTVLHHVCV